MAQFARPDSDALIGNYTDEAAGTTNIFNSINDVAASDATFVQSPILPVNEPYVCGLSTVVDPEVNTGHVVRYRYFKDPNPGQQIDLTVELREGYVNEGTPGTEIASWSHLDIPTTPVTQAQTLSGIEADSITDYSDLFIRQVYNQV